MRRLVPEYAHRRWLTLIILLAFLLRIIWVLKVHTYPVYDFYKYHLGALSIANGEGYKLFGNFTAFEPIGYPGFLAILYKLIAPRIIVPKLFNIFFGIAIILLTYLIGKKLFNKVTGIISAFLIAFSPRNIVYSSVLSTELYFTFFLLLAIYLYLYYEDKKWVSYTIGIITGILALTKPFMLVFPGVLFIFYLLNSRKLLYSIKNAAIIGIFMALTIMPWTIRNYIVFHQFIPISTNGGITLHLNNNDYATGYWQDPFNLPNSPLKPYKNEETGFWDELAVDKIGKQLGKEWILSHPVEFFKLGFKKVYYVFNDSWDVEYSVQKLSNGKPLPNRWWLTDIARAAYFTLLQLLVVYLAVLVWQLVAFFKKIKDDEIDIEEKEYRFKEFANNIIPILIILCFTGINFVFEGQSRYIFPLLPFMAILASWGLTTLIQNYEIKKVMKNDSK